jgi:formiminotetrahydrofolate cyclodeaminase
MTRITGSVAEFLEAAAAKKPTPGGGAVAALTGALGASMLEMTLNYSVGKKWLEAYQGELVPALEAARVVRKRLEGLVEEDQAAYLALTSAKKMPEGDGSKAAAVAGAVDAAVAVPIEIAGRGLEVLELSDRVLNFVNPYLLSDLAVSAELSMATIRAAFYNVRINLPELSSDSRRIEVGQQVAATMQRAGVLIQSVMPRIWTRVG